jgi:hypothetical protein
MVGSSGERTNRATPRPSLVWGVNGEERLVHVVVDLGQVPKLRGRQARRGGEEAAVARIRVQAFDGLQQPVLVVRTDRPDQHLVAAPERTAHL